MSKKKTTPARRARATVRERAVAVITGEAYDPDTRKSIAIALALRDDDLAELVRRAERGDTILDCRDEENPPAPRRPAEAFAHHRAEALRVGRANPDLVPSCVYNYVGEAANELLNCGLNFDSAPVLLLALEGYAALKGGAK